MRICDAATQALTFAAESNLVFEAVAVASESDVVYRARNALVRLPPRLRFRLFREFIKADLHVERGHRPSEIVEIVRLLALRRPSGDLFVEAGCWKGCSSCKFSWVAETFDYQVVIYDSFAGVEVTEEAPDKNFSGMYKSTQQEVQENLIRYGVSGRCTLVPGWFSKCGRGAPRLRQRILIAIWPRHSGSLAQYGSCLPKQVIFPQDYHSGRENAPALDETWSARGRQTAGNTSPGA
jgi:hypothetical protein